MDKTVKKIKLQHWIAWSLLGVSILAFAANLFLEIRGCNILINPDQKEPAFAYGIMMLPINAIAVSFLGALIIQFLPNNLIGWVCIFYGLGFPIGLLGESYGSCSIMNQLNWPGQNQSLWLINFADFTTIGLMLFFWIFPNGKFLSKRWKQIGLALLAITIITSLLDYFWPNQLGEIIGLGGVTVSNPFALPINSPPTLTNLVSQSKQISSLVFALIGILSIIMRWLQSEGEVHLQIKWMTYFLATAGTLFLIVELIGVTIYPQIFDGWFYLIELMIFWLGFPVILGFAIFRFRLYDIDLVIRRTIQYALLTGLLALTYFGGVVILQGIFDPLTGSINSPLITVISTLAIAALFNPLRLRIQEFVDRRFYRRKYDAEQALAKFAATARDEVDMDKLNAALLGVVDETLNPEKSNLWLAEGSSPLERLSKRS